MNKSQPYTLLIAICLLLVVIVPESKAQQLSFRHLGIAEGMPSNVIGHACFDSTGFVWMATNDGLIGYDGTRTYQYLKETHPGLPRNEIGFLFCDSRNRIWICTNEGLAMMDEQRRIQNVLLHDSLKNANIDFCFEVEGVGMIASSTRKTYLLPEGKKSWEPLRWFDDSVRKRAGISSLRAFDRTTYLFVMGRKAMMVDFAAKRVITDVGIPSISSVSKINNDELLATNNDQFELYRIAIRSNTVTKKYTNVTDVQGNKILAPSFASAKSANGQVYISTRSGGLVAFDPDKELFYTYRHEPLNTSTISSDFLRWVFCHPNGYVLITSTSGLNFTNVLTAMFRQHNNFIDATGKIIGGGFSGIAEDVHQQIWLKNLGKLFIWTPGTLVLKNITFPSSRVKGIEINTDAGTINRDDRNNMWVTYNSRGLAKYDANGNLLQFLSEDDHSLPSNNIRITKQLPNRMIIVGAEDGLFMLHPETYQVDSFTTHPLLKQLSRKRIIDIMPDGDKVWIASSPGSGAYCYNFREKTLKTYSIEEGLSSDRAYCIAKDLYNNVYIGTYDGLNIISPAGKIKKINKENGLRHPRVENLVRDKKGKIWISNFNSLICYDPVSAAFSYYDERNGVSNAGFTVVGNTITEDGKIIFSNGGLLLIDPAMVQHEPEYYPPVAIHRLYDDGGYELLHSKDTIHLPYNNSKITLYYLSNTLITANRFFYRYKMQRLDTSWQQPTKNNQVTYNLNPGRYRFQIQASYNEGGWRENDIEITIIVTSPWWQMWWFRLLVLLVSILLVYGLFKRRVREIKNKSAIKQQMAELEAKAIRAQMNPHFIFNSLNAIQECIVTEKVDAAYDYLSRFSKLLRLVLDNSDINFIPLSSELETVKLYLSLEALRFSQSFTYSIEAEDIPDKEDIFIPSLLLQPFVENAIWHGLINKEGEKKILIRFSEKQGKLTCVIEDNGVGRVRAAEIKQQKLGAGKLESKGTRLALQRIEILNQQQPGSAVIETIDLYDSNGKACGTRVIITLSTSLNHSNVIEG